MKNKLLLVGTILYFSIFNSYAEDFKNLKGAREFFSLKSECEYIRPDIALGLTRQGYLLNTYLFGDPHHPVTHFIQSVFNIPPGTENPEYFQVSPLARNFAKFLSPSTVGKLIQILSRWSSPGDWNKAELKAVILNDEGFLKLKMQGEREVEEAQAELDRVNVKICSSMEQLNKRKLDVCQNSQKRKLLTQKIRNLAHDISNSHCDPESYNDTLTGQLEVLDDIFIHLSQEVENLNLAVKRDRSEVGHKIKKKIETLQSKVLFREKYLDNFLALLENAFKSESLMPNVYSRHITEQILLGIGWLNTGDSKEDLLTLFSNIPNCLSEQGMIHIFGKSELDQRRREEWLSDKYNQEDYRRVLELSENPETRIGYFLQHPDQLAFLIYARPYFDSSTLPVISQKQLKYDFEYKDQDQNIRKKRIAFPDCMEGSILRFILYSLSGNKDRNFDVASLENELRRQGYQIHRKLKAFLDKYPNASKANEDFAHHLWARILMNIPGADYVNVSKSVEEPSYELRTSVGNILKVFEYLFYSHPVRRREEGEKLYSNLSRPEKLNRVVELLSKQGKKIDWKIRSETDQLSSENRLEIEFLLNDEPHFLWKLEETHSELQPIRQVTPEWQVSLGKDMIRKMSESNPKLDRKWIGTLAWTLNGDDSGETLKALEALRAERGFPPFMEELKEWLPVETDHQKLRTLEMLLNPPFTSPDRLSQIEARVKKIYERLSSDFDSQKYYHFALTEAGYPFSDTARAVNKSEAIYRKISTSDLSLEVGEDAAHQMGRSWVRHIYGYSLSIGDYLRDETGDVMNTNFEDAKNACLNLNPPHLHERVRRAFEERDRLLSVIRSNGELSEYEKETRIREVHREKQIPGCYLMSKEEWEVPVSDFGYQEGKYIPQILPSLNGQWYWTSTVDSANNQRSFYFDGDFGGLDSINNSSDEVAVRCGCLVHDR